MLGKLYPTAPCPALSLPMGTQIEPTSESCTSWVASSTSSILVSSLSLRAPRHPYKLFCIWEQWQYHTCRWIYLPDYEYRTCTSRQTTSGGFICSTRLAGAPCCSSSTTYSVSHPETVQSNVVIRLHKQPPAAILPTSPVLPAPPAPPTPSPVPRLCSLIATLDYTGNRQRRLHL